MQAAHRLATAPRGPRTCRRCGGREPAVRFDPLAQTLCSACRKAARDARPPRLVADNPAPRPAEPKPGAAPLHLAFVRTLPCAARAPTCIGPVQAHHVRTGTGGGMGMKPADWWCVPLCGFHHGDLHNRGARSFEALHGLDLKAMALRLATLHPTHPQDNEHAR